MSQNTLKSRKYSRKGISSKPKTFRQFKSAVNKIAWRKYHVTREQLGLSIADLKVLHADGDLTADQVVATFAGK